MLEHGRGTQVLPSLRRSPWLIPVAAIALSVSVAGASLRFGPGDPVAVATESEDASSVQQREISHFQDALDGIWAVGDRSVQKALDVNTVDEVPDSSWFEDRIGARAMSVAEITTGPDGLGPAAGPWTVTAAKTEGITPGLQMKDSTGQLYFIKFDPPSNPELGTGAEMIATKLLYAAGYHVPENYIVVVGREDLRVAPGATTHRPDGTKRSMTEGDLTSVLLKAARRADGRYRIVASKALTGKPLGPFAYHGVRTDDPNDTIPHEHRRTLRGLRVFAAWINHVDVKSENSLDTLIRDDTGRSVVRHHLIDFNATLGSAGIGPADRRSGHEYILDRRPILLSLFTFGLYVRPWLTISYPDIPSVGRFEGDRFEPGQWKPTFPNRAMLNAQPDDTFWAARRVMAFSDEAIRAVVAGADYSDPRAADAIAAALIKRRDKIGREWLTSINPLVDFAVDDSSVLHPSAQACAPVLTFDNAAVTSGLATAAAAYHVQWFRFDNARGTVTPVGQVVTAEHPAVPVPVDFCNDADFIAADVGAIHAQHPAWQRPVRVYFRRLRNGWRLVGLERLPQATT